jgi:hypothetical protein
MGVSLIVVGTVSKRTALLWCVILIRPIPSSRLTAVADSAPMNKLKKA